MEGEGWLLEDEGIYLASQALACAGDGCFLPVCAYAMLRRYSRSGPMFCLRMRFLSSRLHSVKITQIICGKTQIATPDSVGINL